jgi:hypothetical protein
MNEVLSCKSLIDMNYAIEITTNKLMRYTMNTDKKDRSIMKEFIFQMEASMANVIGKVLGYGPKELSEHFEKTAKNLEPNIRPESRPHFDAFVEDMKRKIMSGEIKNSREMMEEMHNSSLDEYINAK